MTTFCTCAQLEQRVRELEKGPDIKERFGDRLQTLSLAIEQSSEGIAVVDMDGNLEYLNDAFAQMHGYSAEELIGKNLSVFHALHQIPSVEEANRAVKETGEFKGEIWHTRRDGTVFPTMMHNSIIRDNAGKPIGIMGALRDISDIKQAEEALRESERNMSAVLNNTQDAVVRIDKNFRHIFANPALYAATGLSPEQYLGKTNKELGMPEELRVFWREKHEKVYRNRKPEIFVFSFPTVNKGERVFQAAVCPEFNANNEVETIISFMRDITEIKKAESEKNTVIDKLEKALAEIKTLRGFIPSCSNCKNIRDDEGYWQQIEKYIQERSSAQFSHSICPKCVKELYPDFDIHDDFSG